MQLVSNTVHLDRHGYRTHISLYQQPRTGIASKKMSCFGVWPSAGLQVGTELQPTHKQSSLTYMKVDLVDIEGEDIVMHLPACIDFIDKGRVTGKGWVVGFRSCRRNTRRYKRFAVCLCELLL